MVSVDAKQHWTELAIRSLVKWYVQGTWPSTVQMNKPTGYLLFIKFLKYKTLRRVNSWEITACMWSGLVGTSVTHARALELNTRTINQTIGWQTKQHEGAWVCVCVCVWGGGGGGRGKHPSRYGRLPFNSIPYPPHPTRKGQARTSCWINDTSLIQRDKPMTAG